MIDNYFTESELSCPCCGENKFNKDTLSKFNHLRHKVMFALPMSSGYRCEKYNKLKGYTQTHATGQAGDLQVTHRQSYIVLKHAFECGFTGIGVKQKGITTKRFIHLDDLPNAHNRPRPHVWSY